MLGLLRTGRRGQQSWVQFDFCWRDLLVAVFYRSCLDRLVVDAFSRVA